MRPAVEPRCGARRDRCPGSRRSQLGGSGVRNIAFSLVPGVAFAIAVERTGRLWWNTGLHTGLNFVYRSVFRLRVGATRPALVVIGVAAAPPLVGWLSLPLAPAGGARRAAATGGARSRRLSGRHPAAARSSFGPQAEHGKAPASGVVQRRDEAKRTDAPTRPGRAGQDAARAAQATPRGENTR